MTESRYVPALRFHWLTPAYDAVIRSTTRERRFKSALIEQARFAPGQKVLDHHLSWADKQRTAAELLRVLRPGGELHVADWRRATGTAMRTAFFAVQLLDGFANTQANVEGRLIELFADARFADVAQTASFSTVFGTLALYRATRP